MLWIKCSNSPFSERLALGNPNLLVEEFSNKSAKDLTNLERAMAISHAHILPAGFLILQAMQFH